MYIKCNRGWPAIRILKERFKRLQRGRFRWVVAIIGSIQQSIKYLSPILIYVDKEGDWHNRRRDVILVSPVLNVSSWVAVQAAVDDYWCHSFSPRPGDTIIDIGAGIGDDSVVFSRKVGRNGRVIAIEAHPSTYRCLLKTIKANHLDNVTAINAAVASEEGCITISEEENFLSNSIQTGTGDVPVESNTLDNILRQAGICQIDLVKMNIEGAETSALNGMAEVLHFAANVVVSCHDFKADRGESPIFRTHEHVSRILEKAQFQLFRRSEDSRPEVRYYVYGRKELV